MNITSHIYRLKRKGPFLVLIVFLSCKGNPNDIKEESLKSEYRISHNIQSILDAANVEGAILVYDLKENTYYSNDFGWANTGQLPASTFKIPNSIIGLEIGVIESDSAVFKWGGEKRGLKSWEQDLVVKDAFHYSCVPCYQEVARKIGAERMDDFLRKLKYGDIKVDSANIDNFWLVGDSRVSQMQQVNFLVRLYLSQLPISKQTESTIKKIMVIKEEDHFTLLGKTGLSTENGDYNGWFVGYIELETNTYFFATNLKPKLGFDYETFIKQRMDLTFEVLKQMNILK